MVRKIHHTHTQFLSISHVKTKNISSPQAFPGATAFVLCVCKHTEFSVSLAGHHPAHPAQLTARDPACGVPQAPRPPLATGSANPHLLCICFLLVIIQSTCVFIFDI